MSRKLSLLETVNQAAAGENLPHALYLDFNGCAVKVLSNSFELIVRLKEYYSDFPGQKDCPSPIVVKAVDLPEPKLDLSFTPKIPEPGKTSLKEEYAELEGGRVVRKVRTGMLFAFGGQENWAIGPCLANEPQVVNFINSRHIERTLKSGALLMHAAGVSVNDCGLAIAGFSGAGKSTLALQIMPRGTTFVSNDRLMVGHGPNGLAMTGVAKMPRVNPGTVINNPYLWPSMPEAERLDFAKLPQSELWDLEHKYDAMIDQCFGPGRFKLTAKLAGLVILSWKRVNEPLRAVEVSLNERRDLLPAFMKNPGVFSELKDLELEKDPEPAEYLNLLDACPVLEISGGIDFAKGVQASLDFLAAHSK